jgi:phage shock protein A
MGLFSRLGTLIRSNINELINKAEDPEKMLNQVLVDMKQQLIEAKKQVAVAIADEKRIKKQWEQEAAKASEWEKKAMLAIKAGDDNLARAATSLQRKADHDEVANQLKDQWEAQKNSVEALNASSGGAARPRQQDRGGQATRSRARAAASGSPSSPAACAP